MDAERLEELMREANAGELNLWRAGIDHDEVRELLDAYKSLQRIAELPEGWRSRPFPPAARAWRGAEICANELQQALPEGMRK